jgi:hypothetical protein
LRSPSLRPAGIQRHAPQVSHSSQWHSGTLSCELRARRFVSTRSIRCRSPSMRGHGQRLIGHDGRQYPPVPGGQRPSGAAKPAPGMRSFWRWSGCRMQPPGGGAKPRSDRPACDAHNDGSPTGHPGSHQPHISSELTWLFPVSKAHSLLPYPTRRPGQPVLSVNGR